MISDTANARLNELLAEAAAIAASENRQVEDVLKDALERYQQRSRLDALASRAHRRNAAAGRRGADVERAIAEDRREHPERGR